MEYGGDTWSQYTKLRNSHTYYNVILFLPKVSVNGPFGLIVREGGEPLLL